MLYHVMILHGVPSACNFQGCKYISQRSTARPNVTLSTSPLIRNKNAEKSIEKRYDGDMTDNRRNSNKISTFNRIDGK